MHALRLSRHAENRFDPLDRRMMERALELARQAAELDEVPVGAVVYKGEQIIAEAHNVRESQSDPTGHAELLALRQAADRLGTWRLTGCSIAVTLEPCPMCAGALVNARIDRLVFGTRDPKAGACGSLFKIPTDERLNHRLEVIEGVLSDRCGKVLTEFFRQKRRDRRASA